MLNSQFNTDVNFTRGQFDIKELNAFMNDKKKKAEKELTKYDVDKETQAKAHNMQTIGQMAQYLPLFTKKIKDPKAIKKQKATNDLDYTKGRDQAFSPRAKLAEQIISPRGFTGAQTQRNIATAPTSQDRVIRDPRPRIVTKDKYEEIQRSRKHMETVADVTKKLRSGQEPVVLADGGLKGPADMVDLIGKKTGDSPKKLLNSNDDLFSPNDPLSNNFTIEDPDSRHLRQQIDAKKQELERLTYKHAKAQARFLEIMRELSKFRDEFNEQYSIRSKMLKVHQVTQEIDSLLKIKQQILVKDEQTLKTFGQMELSISDPYTPNKGRSNAISNKQHSLKVIYQISQRLASKSIFHDKEANSNTRMIRLSNQPCFATVSINKLRAECTVTIRTQISHQVLTHCFSKITERFDIWDEIQSHLRLVTEADAQIKLEYVEQITDKYMSNSPESPFYNQDNKIVTYIHGLPQRIITMSISYLPAQYGQSKRYLRIQACDPQFNKQFCTIEVSEDRIFKDLLPAKYQNAKNFEQDIKSFFYKRDLVQAMIRRYFHFVLQVVIVGQDINEEEILRPPNQESPNQKEFQDKKGDFETAISPIDKNSKVGIIDREARGIKFRHTEFPGARIQNSVLAQGGNASMNARSKILSRGIKGNKFLTTQGTSTVRSYVTLSNEVMRSAVQQAINSKRDFANPGQSGAPGTQNQQKRPGQQNNSRGEVALTPANSKMKQIMKLIQSNSMFMQIHNELYVQDKDDYPCYLEIVHNTDDDSLLLFFVDDPNDLAVREVKLTQDLENNVNWQLIMQRFGFNVEQVLCNVETIFRSNEFHLIIQELIQQSRAQRKYMSHLGSQTANNQRTMSQLMDSLQDYSPKLERSISNQGDETAPAAIGRRAHNLLIQFSAAGDGKKGFQLKLNS